MNTSRDKNLRICSHVLEYTHEYALERGLYTLLCTKSSPRCGLKYERHHFHSSATMIPQLPPV
jgi:hypothetical protein